MQPILAITVPFFALVLCGWLAARVGVLPDSAIPGLNAFVLYFALPCMLLRFGMATPLFELLNPALLGERYGADNGRIARIILSSTVSLYGQCADFDTINAIAARHGIPVIEDAAQSFGASYKGRMSCNLSTIACTSFFPSKPLGCYGDGGAIFTNDDELAKVIRQIARHGQDRRYHHIRVGVNSRLDTLQAAILLPKLEILAEEVQLRQQVAANYDRLFKEACGCGESIKFKDMPQDAPHP